MFLTVLQILILLNFFEKFYSLFKILYLIKIKHDKENYRSSQRKKYDYK